MNDQLFSRRGLLRGTAAAALAVGAGGLFAGCTSGPDSTGGQVSRTGVALPEYVPFTGVAGDLPASAAGLQPAFFSYPAEPKSITGAKPITSGDPVTAAAIINNVVRERNDNRYWQALESRLGAEIKILGAPTGDFPAKLATILAGGELPDVVQLYQTTQLPGLLKAKFADLTEHLSGAAIKDFPALANIPTISWPAGVYHNAIYGIPQHRTPQTVSLIIRDDIAKELGVSIEPSNGEEFREMFRQLTDAKNNHWAERSPRNMLGYVNQMIGTPNTWRVDGGKFIRDYTTDEYRQALDILAQMWKEGVFHPDSFSSVSAQVTAWIAAGTVRMVSGPGAFFPSAQAVKDHDPNQTVAVVRPPKWEGGGPAAQYLGPAILCTTALKQAEPDRINELLRMLDYLAAPFGTEEGLFIAYGEEGFHHTRVNGEPVLGEDGKAELFNIGYVMSPPRVHYVAGYPDIAEAEYRAEESAVTVSAPWPTAGLYSATEETKAANLGKTITSLQDEIMRGQRTLRDWDEAVAAWKRDGGDTIAAEYAESLQQSGGS
ncbi:extracellular solute-binding protein [Microlunatus speluncae]|uniref:extracellular solute-binding protein n=1 Tax=Microlunatus speluncae TaxID=2594267 RepID=UPI00126620D7|nr:extracellular solute-binding protein [Microlunatus speluncae]